MEAITTTLMKCEFYHGLYDKFASQGTENALAHHKIFDTFKSTFPELHADVIVVALKAQDYFIPRNGIDKCSRGHQMVLNGTNSCRVAAIKNSLKPFCLEYQPLLEEILRKETVLRELVEGATMAQILGRALDICSGNRAY